MEEDYIAPAVGKIVLPEGYELMNYVIECKLGQGGFGITYLAKEAITGYRVVIKEAFPQGYVYREAETYRVMPYEDCEEETRWALENFQKEACTLRTFAKHDNIVQVNSVFYALNTGYIVMDFIEGKTLNELYPAGKSIGKDELIQIMQKILRALEQLHARGIVHRDIKSANIMMSAAGEPVLIDFGAARPVRNTVSATQIGTPGYAPPEQMSQTNYDKHPKPHIDFYALGATCYRLITGNEPDYVPCKLADDAKLCSKYGRDLLRSIDRARELLPADRWQSAAEWIDALTAEQRAKEEAELKAQKEAEARQKKVSSDLTAEKKARRQAEAREEKLKAEVAAERAARQGAEAREYELSTSVATERRMRQAAEERAQLMSNKLEEERKANAVKASVDTLDWPVRRLFIGHVLMGMLYGAAAVYGVHYLIEGDQQTLDTTWWLCEIGGLLLGAIWGIVFVRSSAVDFFGLILGAGVVGAIIGAIAGGIVGGLEWILNNRDVTSYAIKGAIIVAIALPAFIAWEETEW